VGLGPPEAYSRHEIRLLTSIRQFLEMADAWGGGHLGPTVLADQNWIPDLFLATDMLDLTTFLALTRSKTFGIPMIIYFHENQLSYPWSPDDRDRAKGRDHHYPFINFISALSSDAVLFNSQYHRHTFLTELPRFLGSFPDHRPKSEVLRIKKKANVLPIPLHYDEIDRYKEAKSSGAPIVLWNHRWEYDKNPQEFWETMIQLEDEGYDFQLVIIGECTEQESPLFQKMRQRFKTRILVWGFLQSREEYIRWLWRSHILPVTSFHDFFGVAVLEAMHCGCKVLLPDRLAYPEHLSQEEKNTFLYQPGNLLPKLKELLEKGLSSAGENYKAIGRYALKPTIQAYDDYFQNFLF
jgi:glycosyltransferase involved in cell wall biosynthesis